MSRRGIITIGLFVCAGAAGMLEWRESFLHTASSLHATRAGANVSPLARALRPNYPYSVIPGGVYSAAELRAAVRRDPLVREHYSNFDLNRLLLVRVTQDHYSFVSYRKDNRLFWTRKRLKIPQGEILITDGTNYAKTRCGNRISETPMGNTAPAELQAQVLSPPPIEADQLAGLEFVPAPLPSEADRNAAPIVPFAARPSPASISSLQPETNFPGFTNTPGSVSLGGPGQAAYADTSAPVASLAGPAGLGLFGGSPASGGLSKAGVLFPIAPLLVSTSVSPAVPSASGVASAAVPEPSFRIVFVTLLGVLLLVAGVRAARRIT